MPVSKWLQHVDPARSDPQQQDGHCDSPNELPDYQGLMDQHVRLVFYEAEN